MPRLAAMGRQGAFETLALLAHCPTPCSGTRRTCAGRDAATADARRSRGPSTRCRGLAAAGAAHVRAGGGRGHCERLHCAWMRCGGGVMRKSGDRGPIGGLKSSRARKEGSRRSAGGGTRCLFLQRLPPGPGRRQGAGDGPSRRSRQERGREEAVVETQTLRRRACPPPAPPRSCRRPPSGLICPSQPACRGCGSRNRPPRNCMSCSSIVALPISEWAREIPPRHAWHRRRLPPATRPHLQVRLPASRLPAHAMRWTRSCEVCLFVWRCVPAEWHP